MHIWLQLLHAIPSTSLAKLNHKMDLWLNYDRKCQSPVNFRLIYQVCAALVVLFLIFGSAARLQPGSEPTSFETNQTSPIAAIISATEGASMIWDEAREKTATMAALVPEFALAQGGYFEKTTESVAMLAKDFHTDYTFVRALTFAVALVFLFVFRKSLGSCAIVNFIWIACEVGLRHAAGNVSSPAAALIMAGCITFSIFIAVIYWWVPISDMFLTFSPEEANIPMGDLPPVHAAVPCNAERIFRTLRACSATPLDGPSLQGRRASNIEEVSIAEVSTSRTRAFWTRRRERFSSRRKELP